MIPQPLAIDPFTSGDHFPLIGPVVITVGGTAPATAMQTVRWRFKQGSTVVELSSADSEITINSAAGWSFTVPRQAVPTLTAGTWTWQGEITDAAGVVDTYLADTLTILPDV